MPTRLTNDIQSIRQKRQVKPQKRTIRIKRDKVRAHSSVYKKNIVPSFVFVLVPEIVYITYCFFRICLEHNLYILFRLDTGHGRHLR